MIAPPDMKPDDISAHNPFSQRLDAKLVAKLYGVSVTRLAKWSGVKYNTVKKTPDSPTMQPALAKLVNAFEQLKRVLSTQRAVREWLNHPVTEKDWTPISTLDRSDDIDGFCAFIDGQIADDSVHD
jgi:hypothetical protein